LNFATLKRFMWRDWTEIPPNSLLGAVLRFPLRLIPKNTVMRVRAGLNKDMKWVKGSGIHSCWLGLYEPYKQRAIEPFVRPGMTVFDVGANAGFYTLAFSRLVGSDGCVLAFEPLAENVNNLLRHVRINRLDNVILVQAAIANRSGIEGFKVGEDNSTGSISGGETYKVPALTLDDLVEDKVACVPDVIKIDVEGAESLVLEGARKLLSAKKTTLFVALHGDEQKTRCRKLLGTLEYKIFLLDGSALGNERLQNDDIYAVPIDSSYGE